jgi:RNA polymerase sigma-70 factor (ECF subfamily)
VEPALRDKIVTDDAKRSKGSIELPTASDAVAPELCAESIEPLSDALQKNAQGLWRFLLVRVGRDENLAEELMQELCLQAARTYTKAGEAKHIDAWLFGVARNVLRRHWRTITRRRRNLPEVRADVGVELANLFDAEPLPSAYIERREVREQVLLAVSSLATEDQNLILLHYFDGRSQADIASDLGVSPRAVEGRLYRARVALRERLRHLEDEPG